jgi:hypothetical protein
MKRCCMRNRIQVFGCSAGLVLLAGGAYAQQAAPTPQASAEDAGLGHLPILPAVVIHAGRPLFS